MTAPERSTLRTNGDQPDRNAIDAQLSRLIASEEFTGSPRLQQLLSYLVSETLSGRSDRIKGVTIAQDIFGHTDPEIAQSSTVVSVEARRLRRKLSDYYRAEGANDLVEIEVPKGAYVPVFRHINSQTETHDAPEKRVSPSRLHRQRKVLFLGIGLTIGLATLLILLWISDATTQVQADYSLTQPAIAVMPFRNSTGSPLNDDLAAGLTEDITTDLARLREIDVISYSSVSLLTSPQMTSMDIAETLAVSHILHGNIRGTTPNIRVNAELLDARSGRIIWASRLDRDFGDPLALQNEIASKVIEGMSIGLSTWKDVGRETSRAADPEAAALFDQAIGLANPPSDATRLKIAKLAFEAVIEADPSYSGGYAGVAYIGAFKALWGHVPDPKAEASASALLASQALDLDPESSLALDALALSKLVLKDFDEAVKLSERAIDVAPNDPYAHSYHAFILTANGQPDEAIPYAERAVRLDPLDPRTPYLNILAVVQLHAGHFGEALQSLLESEQRGGPQAAGHIASKAAAYAGLGELEEAASLAATLPPGFIEGPWLEWQQRSFRYPEDALAILALIKRAN